MGGRVDLYSVLLLLSTFVVFFLVYGLAWSVGVLYVVFMEHLEYDHPPQVALGVALTCAVIYIMGPLSSELIDRFGCRAVGIVGGLLAGGGLILTTLSSHVGVMCAMFGVVVGTGFGLCTMAATVVLCVHFERFRPIALGITSSAIGVGWLAYPPILWALVDHYGWRGTLQIVGAVTLNLMVCAALYRPFQDRLTVNSETKEKRSFLAQFQIFTDKSFVALCFSNVLICLGFSVIHVHLPAYAATLGFEETQCALLFSGMGVGCIAGRLMTGLLNQVPACNGFLIYVLFFALSGLCVLAMPFGPTYGTLLGLCVAFGVFTGCYGITVLDMIIRILGVSRVGVGYGYCMLFMGIGQSVGGPLAGIVYETSGRYSATMYFGGAMLIAGGLLVLPGLVQEYRGRKATNYESTLAIEPDGNAV